MFSLTVKNLLGIAAIVLLSAGCGRIQNSGSTSTPDSAIRNNADADSFGMKSYVMAFLKKGPNRNQDSATAAAIQKAHLANIGKLADEGKLIIAGPFMDSSEFMGIFIFNVKTLKEAEELTLTDPAVKAGRLIMELHPWYSSAALTEIPQLHKKLEKKPVTAH